MAERKQITLLYQYNDNWIGGTYYIQNIIKALLILEDNDKPFLRILYNSEKSLNSINNLKYPYIDFLFFDIKFSFIEKVINKISFELFSLPILKKKVKFDGVKNVYPIDFGIEPSSIYGFYFWIPDFQEWYFPSFFSKQEISYRKAFQKHLVKKNYPIVFSSNNALNDFNRFYPNNKNRKEVLQFVSILDDRYSKLDISVLKEKFNIDRNYFIVPNQFWKHKNHIIIIEAAKVLKERKNDFLIVFTGKEFDYRNPTYTTDLKKEIKKNGLDDYFLFLGFIDRCEQLQLMKNSIAILQPSLFEGWSTVVEDCKALNHVILLSDIPLHREQIKNNCLFFDPTDKYALADKLLYAMNNNLVNFNFDVNKEQLHFAKKIISLF